MRHQLKKSLSLSVIKTVLIGFEKFKSIPIKKLKKQSFSFLNQFLAFKPNTRFFEIFNFFFTHFLMNVLSSFCAIACIPSQSSCASSQYLSNFWPKICYFCKKIFFWEKWWIQGIKSSMYGWNSFKCRFCQWKSPKNPGQPFLWCTPDRYLTISNFPVEFFPTCRIPVCAICR